MPVVILNPADKVELFNGLDAFTKGYLDAMFFTIDEDLNQCTLADLSDETMSAIFLDCERFKRDNAETLAAAIETCIRAFAVNEGDAGIDFWFTRNGHGSGFWAGYWPEPYATQLDEAAKNYGSVDLYQGDDGLLYLA